MPPQRGIYYGWVLVITLAITEITSWGVLYYSFGLFLPAMEAELGWPRAVFTGAFSVALLLSGIAGIPVGRLLDRYGTRALMTVGSIVATLLTLAWSAVDNPIAFYVIWGLIGVTMAAVLYEPAFVVVANWFQRQRGRALTVLTFIAGFASVIYLPLANWLIGAQGWRGALVTLAALVAVGTILPHALILRRRPADLGLQIDGGDTGTASPGQPAKPKIERSLTLKAALRDPAFWWLTAAFSLNMLTAVAVTVHLVSHLIGVGYDRDFAGWAAGLIGLMALPGRLVFTPLGDRFPRSVIAAALFMLQTIALAVLLLVQSPAGVLAFIVIFGAGFGAITPSRVALLADYYGSTNYGAISGVLMFYVTAARAAAPVGAGLGFDFLGSYDTIFWWLAAISAFGAVAVVMADVAVRRRGDESS